MHNKILQYGLPRGIWRQSAQEAVLLRPAGKLNFHITRGAYQGHKRHSFLNRLITGTWSLKTMTHIRNVYSFTFSPVTLHVCLGELFFAYAPFTLRMATRICGIRRQEGWLAVFFCQITRLLFPRTRGCQMRAMRLSCIVWTVLYSGHKINIICPTSAGNRHFCDLLLYCISSEKLLKYYINMVVYSC